jgi:hypothetical protein
MSKEKLGDHLHRFVSTKFLGKSAILMLAAGQNIN